MNEQKILKEFVPNYSADLIASLQAEIRRGEHGWRSVIDCAGVNFANKFHVSLSIKDLIQSLRLAEKFMLPEYGYVIEDYELCNKTCSEEGRLRIPYPIICLEYSIQEGSIPHVMLCQEYELEDEVFISFLMFVKTDREWGIFPHINVLGQNEKGIVWNYEDVSVREVMADDEEGIKESCIDYAYILLDFITCSGLRGFSCEKFVPSKTLNKKMRREHGLPFFEYHVLGIGLKHLNYKGPDRQIQNPGSGGKHRWHSVRGHIRHYREKDKMAWIRPHFAGNPALGIIKKDYTLK